MFHINQQVAIVSARGTEKQFLKAVRVVRIMPKLVETDDGLRWQKESGVKHPHSGYGAGRYLIESMSEEHIKAYQEKLRKKAKSLDYRRKEKEARALFIQRLDALKSYLLELAEDGADPKQEKAFAEELYRSALAGWDYQP